MKTKMTPSEIAEHLQRLNINLSLMTYDEFVLGIMEAFGVTRTVAKQVAKKTGNW